MNTREFQEKSGYITNFYIIHEMLLSYKFVWILKIEVICFLQQTFNSVFFLVY